MKGSEMGTSVSQHSHTTRGCILARIFRQLPGNAASPTNTLPNGLMATHGSQLMKLSLLYEELPSFLDEVVSSISSNASIVRLPSLTVLDNYYFALSSEEEHEHFYRTMYESLSEVTCLKELNIESMNNESNHSSRFFRTFAKLFRGNFSMRVISFAPDVKDDPVSIEAKDLMQAYCGRNVWLLHLLMNISGSSEIEDLEDTPSQNQGGLMDKGARETVTAPFLFPSLLAVAAKHMPTTNLATTFRSLLQSEMSIGPSEYSM